MFSLCIVVQIPDIPNKGSTGNQTSLSLSLSTNTKSTHTTLYHSVNVPTYTQLVPLKIIITISSFTYSWGTTYDYF